MKMEQKVTIIIPTFNDVDLFRMVLEAISNQTILPHELIVVDSSTDNSIQNLIESSSYKFNIRHEKTLSRIFPYEATNLGVKLTSTEWVAFLDTKTIPTSEWLEKYFKIITQENLDIIFGVTKYLASSSYQRLLRDSTYGRLGLETAPGSIMRKNDFLDSGSIIEGVRSAGDIEWRSRLKKMRYKWATPEQVFLSYDDLPNSLLLTIKKFFIYQLHGARVNAQSNIKDVYYVLALLLSAIIIPRWNPIVGWEKSSLYMPNVTKIYLLALLVFLLSSFLINRVLFKSIPSSNLFINILKALIFLFLFLGVYNWNAVLAGWVEDSVWYIPHITKIYIGLIISASVLYRGILFPLRHGVKSGDIFPLRWVKIGLLGLLLDIVKAPGYVIGGIVMPFIKKRN